MHSRWFDLLALLGGAAFLVDARTLRGTFASDGLIALSGYTHERWQADPPLLPDLVHPDDRARVLLATRDATAETPCVVEHRLVRADQGVRRCRTALRARPGGELQGIVLDITAEREGDRPLAVAAEELRHGQAALVQRERHAALGELASVVAHEVRNPLGAIYTSLGTLRKMVSLDGDAALLFDILQEEAARLNRLTIDLLLWVRPLHPALRLQRLAPLVEQAVATAERSAPSPRPLVRIDRRLDGALPPVALDPELFHTALVNVLANALQSMPRGGALGVEVCALERDGQRWASISVSDSGPGVPVEVIDRIFEPFVTTRATGTGLGLALAKRIVDAHGGEVDVENRPGAGATFTLRLRLDHGAP